MGGQGRKRVERVSGQVRVETRKCRPAALRRTAPCVACTRVLPLLLPGLAPSCGSTGLTTYVHHCAPMQMPLLLMRLCRRRAWVPCRSHTLWTRSSRPRPKPWRPRALDSTRSTSRRRAPRCPCCEGPGGWWVLLRGAVPAAGGRWWQAEAVVGGAGGGRRRRRLQAGGGGGGVRQQEAVARVGRRQEVVVGASGSSLLQEWAAVVGRRSTRIALGSRKAGKCLLEVSE